VLPLALRGPETQRAVAFDLVGDHLASASVRPCAFMPLRGPFAGPIQEVPLQSAPGVRIAHDQAGRVDMEAVAEWLQKPSRSLASGVRANALAVGRSLNLWLALHDHRFCALSVEPGAAASGASSPPLPSVYQRGGSIRTSVGLLDAHGLALLSRRADPTGVADGDEWSRDAPSTELEVHGFGTQTGLAERLRALVRAWDAGDRPTSDHLSVRAYRGAAPASLSDGRQQVVTKHWTRLVLDWS